MQKGPICFFLPRSKLIILVNAELYFILGLLWFYQVSTGEYAVEK